MTGTYNNLWLAGIDSEYHKRTCGYWYVVDNSACSYTAFRTKEHLKAWLSANNLSIDCDIPEEIGTPFSSRITGTITEVFETVKNIMAMDNKFYCLSNGSYTIGAMKNNIQYKPNINDLNFITLDYQKTAKRLDNGQYFIVG